MGRLGAALFIWSRARCHGAGSHGGKALVDSLLFTTKPAIDALTLVRRRRAAPSRLVSRSPKGEGGRTSRGRERCKRPMVRDASLRDAPHHEVFGTRATRAPHREVFIRRGPIATPGSHC